MTRGFPSVQFLFRICFAAMLGYQAAAMLILPALVYHGQSYQAVVDELPYATIALNALLLIISIWLLFGIRTRVVAVLGVALFTTLVLTGRSNVLLDLDGKIVVVAIFSLALPLVAFGGGRWRLYPKDGWHDVI
ncbi:MAG: hypothetical protein WCD16_05660 [Paracoccaceae bacterium]